MNEIPKTSLSSEIASLPFKNIPENIIDSSDWLTSELNEVMANIGGTSVSS